MLNNELIEFIRGRRQLGTKDDEIKGLLIQQGGWSEIDINEAMKTVDFGQNTTSSKFSITKIIIVAIILVIVILGFIFNKKISGLISFSSKAPYSEQNMVSGIFDKAKTVESARYLASLSLLAKNRDQGARPIVIPKVDPKIEEAYKRDYKSYQNIQKILVVIDRQRRFKMPLPNNIKDIVDLDKKNYSNSNLKIVDENGKPYIYTLSSDKKHAFLTVSFESKEMIEKIKNHYLTENKIYTEYSKKLVSENIDSSQRIIPNIPDIKDKQVTFDETAGFAPLYLYSDKYPESALSSYVMLTKQIPENIDASVKASGTYQKSKLDTISDFETSLDFKALVGIANFSAGFDIKKTGLIYYARIRDFPDLSYFSSLKTIQNKWVKFDTTLKSSEKDSGAISEYALYFSNMNSSTSTRDYSKSASDNFNKLLAIAERNNLFGLRNPISSEKYNNISVFRYDIKINMDKVPAVLDEISKIDSDYASAYYSMLLNLKEDQSQEFKDFVENNVFITLWVDSSGIMQKGQFKIRVVPPEDQGGFSGKQIELVSDLSLENVNEKINIVAPDKSITPAEADKLIEDNQSPAVKAKRADAIVISSVMQVRTIAESGYKTNYSSTLTYNNSSIVHGAGIKSVGDAKKILDSSKSVGSTLYAITDRDLKSYAIYGKLLSSDKYFCLDSTGRTVSETSNKTKIICTK